MNRRTLLKGALLSASALALRPALTLAADGDGATARLTALERRHGGRLGVAIIDTGNDRRILYRADERFMMCSTFKLLLVAATLARVEHGAERLDRRVIFERDVILSYAPVTSLHVGPPGLTVAELCKAAITLSDNTAANLLLASLGGPAAVTAYARQLGDPITRLDHIEPELNRPSPDRVSDTTAPAAMMANLHALMLGNALGDTSRKQLTEWLCETTTGSKLLRAGIPDGWRVGDKTGSGNGATNDVAIIWPPNRQPLLVAAYYAAPAADDAGRSAVLAEVGRIAASI
jgi:beta-lactamase class A